MKILVGVGNMPLEQLELAPPKSEPRRAVDDADVAGVGADDGALTTLHSPELNQAHVKDERRRGVSLFSYPYLAFQLIDDVARVSSSRPLCDSSVRALARLLRSMLK